METLVIFGFGLLRSLSFAALLHNMLTKDNFISVLAFNVEVELVNLDLIMAILVIAIFEKSKQKSIKFLHIIIGLIGLYWFVDSLI